METLVIGGTRNLGPPLVRALVERGHRVAVFNRGLTPGELPAGVERLAGDRRDPAQLRAALGRRSFDLVVDTTLYDGAEAESAIELFDGRVGRYVFLSTGQVYLVRRGVSRPFAEEDYDGPLVEEPAAASPDRDDWLYGAWKREAEDAFARARAERGFPYTSLRLPMVNSELDHYRRIYNYFLRLKDGGPVVAPDRPRHALRHVYGGDVISAVLLLSESEAGRGRAYNLSQDETVTLEEFLGMMAGIMGAGLELVRVPREELERRGLLPSCSPFSGRWMSELTNERGKRELGLVYTPLREYLRRLVEYYAAHPPDPHEGYARREEELRLAREFGERSQA
ncbi:MAG TPA: NAD-dependent epimerase/dehydratase family protein [Pyrinomonadaceae bacterium]|nr:NAD-dependent epimerase/dehydratase family protein [Pyrinomonadaceae bacterium]